MRNCLISGGAGFVGRAFTRRLVRDGWKVVVLDNLCSGLPYKEWWDPALPHSLLLGPEWDVRRDCAGMDSVDDYDLIVHCAAVVGGRLKIDGDPIAVGTDLAIDAALWNWVVKAKTKPQIVYFSSSAVYPIELQTRRQYVNLSESLVSQGASRFGRPDSVYGWCKLTGEMLAHYAVEQYEANAVIYRPFSGYGEDQSFDYPFPSIIRRVVNRENPITIWGSGEQCRDFIHIDDIVDAVMETKDVLKPGEVLNLGSGIATSFRDLAEAAFQVAGVASRVEFEFDTSKPEGVFYRVADTYKLSQFYKPKVSLEEGIRRVAKHLTEGKA